MTTTKQITFKVKEETTEFTQITKRFYIELPNGKQAQVEKYWKADHVANDYDSDYEIMNLDELELDEETEDELVDFISELK